MAEEKLSVQEWQLARHGMNTAGCAFLLRSDAPQRRKSQKDVDAQGVQSLFFNVNDLDPEKRKEVVDELKKEFNKSPELTVRVLMHSLAFGTLRPLVSKDIKEQMTQETYVTAPGKKTQRCIASWFSGGVEPGTGDERFSHPCPHHQRSR